MSKQNSPNVKRKMARITRQRQEWIKRRDAQLEAMDAAGIRRRNFLVPGRPPRQRQSYLGVIAGLLARAKRAAKLEKEA